ncbi:MAG: NAD(P) transhydrogenase subunit alpha [Archangium sp.]|nr:NAD(P) transhydrogenase subunit alpha [Archangium sp.]
MADVVTVFVPRERTEGERRVAQVPDTVARLVKAGLQVQVESGAGVASGYADADFEKAGAKVVRDRDEALRTAAVVLKVQPPDDGERALLRAGALVVSFLPAVLRPSFAEAKVDALAMERVPRTTRGQAADALSSQATVAGYKAVLMGADRLPRLLPMMTTAAGTLTPGRVLVLGAGVAGLQAVATAHRLGAVVTAFDVRAAAKEQVLSLGAKFLEVEGVASAEGQGGYAKEVASDEQARILSTLGKAVPQADLVVSTAAIPGKAAPRLITSAMVAQMRNGSVIVDLAAESGGNCELTRVGETVLTDNGVTVLGPRQLASHMPFHGSAMYARNVATLLQWCVKDGQLELNLADDVIAAMLVTHQGAVRHA